MIFQMGSTERYLRPGDQGYNWEEVGYPQEYSVKEYRTLRLLWEDRATSDIEYQLRYNNSRRGFWVSSAPHSGSRGMYYKIISNTIEM